MPAYQKIQYQRSFREKPDKALRSVHSLGKSLPAINPYPWATVSANSAPVQMYREENAYKISDNNEFAVFKEGEPDSKMYANKNAKPAKLKEEVVTFNMVDTTDYPKNFGMQEVVPDKKMSPEEIKKIHCGPFSQKATGRLEDVENENAPPGRSLFVKDFRWSDPQGLKEDNPSRGTWENHYAPVILQDGDDRGTFETAVHIDHAYFGIYGNKKGQTFRLKTVMADIELSVKRGLLSPEVADQLKQGIRNYINDDPKGTDDEYLKQEIQKIDELSKSKPDIDEPAREREKQRLETEKQREAFWHLVETKSEEEIWSYITEQNNISSARSYLIQFKDRATKEDKRELVKKIQGCLQRIDNGSGADKKESTGIGVGTLVAGTFFAASIVAGIAWRIFTHLKRNGYI